MKKMTNDIMRELNAFAEIAKKELTSKLAWRAEAEAQLEQANQRLSNAKTAAEIEEAGNARREAWSAIEYREGWVKRAQGYQSAVKLITKSIQDLIEEEREDFSELPVEDEAKSA